jgi:hypothetical protein
MKLFTEIKQPTLKVVHTLLCLLISSRGRRTWMNVVISSLHPHHLSLPPTRPIHIPLTIVPSVQQKSSGLKFSKSRTGSHVTYSCHHQFEPFYIPHICAFVAFLSLPFITTNHATYILTKDTNTFT